MAENAFGGGMSNRGFESWACCRHVEDAVTARTILNNGAPSRLEEERS
jgi:hypothetical protein